MYYFFGSADSDVVALPVETQSSLPPPPAQPEEPAAQASRSQSNLATEATQAMDVHEPDSETDGSPREEPITEAIAAAVQKAKSYVVHKLFFNSAESLYTFYLFHL